jgi:hypothetical protein
MSRFLARRLLFPVPILLILAAAGLAPAPAQAAITLVQDFDNGNLDVVNSHVDLSNPSAPAITIACRANWTTEPTTWGWMYFYADGVSGTAPVFRINSNYVYVTNDHRYVYSYDQQTWYYFDNGVIDSSSYYNWSNNAPFTQNRVYVAANIPYHTWQVSQYVASMITNPYVFRTASGDANYAVGYTRGTAGRDTNGNLYYDDLGRTIPSLPLYGFAITDSNSTVHKAHIVIQAGNHACESEGNYELEGMVQAVLANAPAGDFLRKHAVFYIYPLINPEGTWAGYWRSTPITPAGDHNRVWADNNNMANGLASPTQNPEVYTLEHAERTDTGGYVDYFFDLHGQGNILQNTVCTQQTYNSPYIANFLVRDPAQAYPYTLVWGPITMAEYWAADPWTPNGGLAATYSLTPEVGQFPNVSADGLRAFGTPYMLALYDTLLAPQRVNQAPVVTAGPNLSIQLPTNKVSLAGTISDDGLPAGATVTAKWTKTSGPGTVRFRNAAAAATTATFSTTGTYVLRLTASDTALSAYAECQIIVSPVPINQAPVVTAGPNQSIQLLVNQVSLAGTVSDDGLPAGTTVTATWSMTSGPGTVTFGNASAAATTATFSTSGTYVLQLTASDSVLLGTSNVTVTVLAPGDFNGDGRVDGVDFLIWQSHYPTASGATPDGGDANDDGKVDGVDFLIWQANYHG